MKKLLATIGLMFLMFASSFAQEEQPKWIKEIS